MSYIRLNTASSEPRNRVEQIGAVESVKAASDIVSTSRDVLGVLQSDTEYVVRARIRDS